MPHRIREVRGIDQLQSAMGEEPYALGLIEVRLENLAATFELLSKEKRPQAPIVALLHETLRQDSNAENRLPGEYQFSEDALREAGALAVIDSPRRISSLLELTQQLSANSTRFTTAADGRASFAEWAWAALPWQDE
jgi:hypothetical protein